MAIAPMKKVMIVAHRSQAADVLSSLQSAGIIQVLDAELAKVSKAYPELHTEIKRPRDLEDRLYRLDKAISFLKQYAVGKPLGTAFAPLVKIDAKFYNETILSEESQELLDEAENAQNQIETLGGQLESIAAEITKLTPWKELTTPVEQIHSLSSSVCFSGFLPVQQVENVKAALGQFPAAIQLLSQGTAVQPCLVAVLHEKASEVQKLLRSSEFEPVSLEGYKGIVSDILDEKNRETIRIQEQLSRWKKKSQQLANDRLTLHVLYDHTYNLLTCRNTQATAPATEKAIFFEGWVKEKDYPLLQKLVSQFDAADLETVAPGEGEEPPVEIENPAMVRPFETVTRLYGMPLPTSVDPTVFLAPFFAISFGLCMADVGYGLVMLGLLLWAIKKMQGGKAALWLLVICSITTIMAGLITGSWFSDSITTYLGTDSVFEKMRVKMMLFDPMTQPMTFFGLSLAIGYIQILFGLFIAFFANLFKKDISAAIYDQLTWIVLLNCLMGMGLSAGGILPASLSKIFGYTALAPAAIILLFSGRGVPWAGRIGLGVYQLFSTVFYGGDLLSYARLMALGMVGSGFGLAINILVKLAADIPYVGWLLGIVVFVGGHLLNVALSILGAFVHTMRLQFVEFFPKFFTGGGVEFQPLRNDYRYVAVKK